MQWISIFPNQIHFYKHLKLLRNTVSKMLSQCVTTTNNNSAFGPVGKASGELFFWRWTYRYASLMCAVQNRMLTLQLFLMAETFIEFSLTASPFGLFAYLLCGIKKFIYTHKLLVQFSLLAGVGFILTCPAASHQGVIKCFGSFPRSLMLSILTFTKDCE